MIEPDPARSLFMVEPEPRVLRARTFPVEWKVAIERLQGQYPRNARCSACRCTIHPGEAYVTMLGKRNLHRQCLKEWIDQTYDQIPPQPDEIARTGDGLIGQIDPEAAERAFREYRQALLERFSAADLDISAGQHLGASSR